MSGNSSEATADKARLVEELTEVGDPQERLVKATALLEELRQRQLVVAGIRDAAMQSLHEQGLSYAEIARTARTTRGRVAQIVRARCTAAAPGGPGGAGSTRADG
jgi:pyruvate/2-oxoglutarate dehydrogenase complex dihydrolipoamide acyltransferase (E2) component